MSTDDLSAVVERQLLLQLGERLRRLRKAQGLSAEAMAARVGVTRPTLRNVEAGDPGTAIGTYVRVMSLLGVSGELALLAGDAFVPAPADSAAARSGRTGPAIQVYIRADTGRHQLQDLQSLALHEEAVRLARSDPALVERAKAVTQRWLETGDVRSASLWREWLDILAAGAWRKALGRSRHAQQLRQASPLVTVLPEATRQTILQQIGQLRSGLVLGGEAQGAGQEPEGRTAP